MFYADLRHCGLVAHIGFDLANTTPTVPPAVCGQRVRFAVQFTATNFTFHDVVSPCDATTAIGRILPHAPRPTPPDHKNTSVGLIRASSNPHPNQGETQQDGGARKTSAMGHLLAARSPLKMAPFCAHSGIHSERCAIADHCVPQTSPLQSHTKSIKRTILI
jgi:hypothetical protein